MALGKGTSRSLEPQEGPRRQQQQTPAPFPSSAAARAPPGPCSSCTSPGEGRGGTSPGRSGCRDCARGPQLFPKQVRLPPCSRLPGGPAQDRLPHPSATGPVLPVLRPTGATAPAHPGTRLFPSAKVKVQGSVPLGQRSGGTTRPRSPAGPAQPCPRRGSFQAPGGRGAGSPRAQRRGDSACEGPTPRAGRGWGDNTQSCQKSTIAPGAPEGSAKGKHRLNMS